MDIIAQMFLQVTLVTQGSALCTVRLFISSFPFLGNPSGWRAIHFHSISMNYAVAGEATCSRHSGLPQTEQELLGGMGWCNTLALLLPFTLDLFGSCQTDPRFLVPPRCSSSSLKFIPRVRQDLHFLFKESMPQGVWHWSAALGLESCI